jgi:hypothetical protein
MLAQALIAEADAFVAQWKDLKLPDGRFWLQCSHCDLYESSEILFPPSDTLRRREGGLGALGNHLAAAGTAAVTFTTQPAIAGRCGMA